jgi:Holliday junction resolvase RusA-like endonuclease
VSVIQVDVRGVPRPQGSVQQFRAPNGHTVTKHPVELHEWRGKVEFAARTVAEQMQTEPMDGPVELRVGFDLLRPRSHFGTGRNAHTVKPSAPRWPDGSPDLDKLVRGIGDALTMAGVFIDDRQVVSIVAAKRYVEPPALPGVFITVTPMEDS